LGNKAWGDYLLWSEIVTDRYWPEAAAASQNLRKLVINPNQPKIAAIPKY
jgi:hypothetical protein